MVLTTDLDDVQTTDQSFTVKSFSRGEFNFETAQNVRIQYSAACR